MTTVPAEIAERPKVATIQLQNIVLEDFERAVYRGDLEEGSRQLMTLLQRLKQGASFVGYAPTPEVLRVCYTRACAAIIALLANPNYQVSAQGFTLIASEHATMDTLFKLSQFGTSDHLLLLLSDPVPNGKPGEMKAEGPGIVKYLLTQSLMSRFGVNYEHALKQNPDALFPLWCGMLSPIITATEQSSQRREELLGLHQVFENIGGVQMLIPALSDAFMYTSYALRRDKHQAKRAILGAIRRGMHASNLPLPTPGMLAERRARKDQPGYRPTILVCVEWFGGQHAMFRCYAPIIRQLRQRFRLVAMSRAMDIDDIGKAEFDEWHEVIGDPLVLEQVVGKVNEIAPDIIYNPSLGMAMWWVALATVKLAPIHIMTLGHPASSMSEQMDYVLCDRGAIGDPALFSERIVEYPNGSARYVLRTDEDVPEPCTGQVVDNTIHIAVPAMMCKLSVPFLAACKAVTERARRPVRFHFFVNMMGANLLQSAREIRTWVPEAFTYERTTYSHYMGNLRLCHINACTFPFGGTNSNIDALMVGLPMVCIEGDEPHARFDAQMVRRAGLPEWLIAKTPEQWVETMLRLVHDHGERQALRQHLLDFDLKAEFYGPPPDPTAFLRAVSLVYDRHEELQANIRDPIEFDGIRVLSRQFSVSEDADDAALTKETASCSSS